MKIHWFRTDLLVAELARGEVREEASVFYMMLGAGVFTFAFYGNGWFGGGLPQDWRIVFEFVLVLAISMFGVRSCYTANGAASGKEFIKRYTAISVPVGIKYYVVTLALVQLTYLLLPKYFSGSAVDLSYAYRFIFFAIAVLGNFVYFSLIAHHIGRVRQLSLVKKV